MICDKIISGKISKKNFLEVKKNGKKNFTRFTKH